MDKMAIELRSFVNAERDKMSIKKSALHNIIFLAVVCGLFFFTFHFVFGIAMVNGTSMGNTIKQNSVIFYNRLAKNNPGDIVVAKYGDSLLVKRQIATGGQVVDIVDGKVSVDGKVLAENYISNPKTSQRDVQFPYTVPKGHVFILGDNRAASVDSRNSQIGSVESDDIVGKVLVIK